MSKKAPYMPVWINDWLAGTMGLSFEQRGMLIELCVRMWDCGGPLPADTAWLAGAMQRDKREVRRLVSELVALGKVRQEGDSLVNDRVAHELREREARSKSAVEREAEKRLSPKLPAEVDDTSSRSSGEVGEKFERSPGDFPAKSTHGRADSRAQEPTHTNPKEKILDSRLVGVGCRAGATLPRGWRHDAIERLVAASPALNCDLAATVAALRDIEGRHGVLALTEGFAAFDAAIASGTTVDDPIRYVAKVARSKARDRSGHQGAPCGNIPDPLAGYRPTAVASTALRALIGGTA